MLSPATSVRIRSDLVAIHAGETGWVEDVFDDGVSVHVPINPLGFEFWAWNDIEAHYPKGVLGVYQPLRDV